MKNFPIALVLFFCVLVQIQGQKTINLSKDQTSFTVLENLADKIVLRTTISEIDFQLIKNNSENYSSIQLPGFVTNHIKGNPDLPTFNKLLDIPYGATVDVNIVSFEEEEVVLSANQLHKIVPA